MRRLLACKAGCFTAILLFVTTVANAQNYSYGMVTSVLDPPHGAKVTELGAGYVRLNFYWWLIEPAQDDYRWGDVDRWLNEASSRNLKVFASLTETAPWAGPCQYCTPYQILDWYDFVWQVIKHCQVNYPGLEVVFGIWNEPNLGFLDDDLWASMYGVMFQYASLARNDANPAARLGGPETSHHARGHLSEPLLRRSVTEAKLDRVAFDLCVSSQANETIQRDIQIARDEDVSATPTFLIGYVEPSHQVRVVRRLVGVPTAAAFERTIEDVISTQRP